MATVRTSTVIMVFVLILVIAAMAALFIDPETFDKTRWRTFLVTAASLGIIITFMWYFFLVEQNIRTEQATDLNERRHIEEGIIDASVKEIQNNSDIIPEFCASLFPLQDFCEKSRDSQQDFSCSLNEKSRDSQQDSRCPLKKKILHEVTLSYRLFDTWEHFTEASLHPVGDVTYFLQWASSKQLEDQWRKQHINFTKKTREFGDLLFERAKLIKDRTPSAYNHEAYKLFRECRDRDFL